MRTVLPFVAVASLSLLADGCVDVPDYSSLINAMQGLTHPAEAAPTNAIGTLHVMPREGLSLDLAPRYCRSGQPRAFQGVDLAADGDDPALVRVVEDPIAGTRVRVEHARGGAPWVLDAAHCTTLASDVHGTSVAINRVGVVAGVLDLDCTADDGTRVRGAVRFDQCHSSPAADAAIAAIAATREIGTLPAVPDAAVEAPPSRALHALRAAASARVVNDTVGGEAPATASRACLEGSRELLARAGFESVDASAPHDVDVEFACTGHVTYRSVGGLTEILLPDAGPASVRVRADGAEIASIAPLPRTWRCAGSGDLAHREHDCGERLGRFASARIATFLATSPAIASLAARHASAVN